MNEFTLIEVLGVVILLGVLATIIYPIINKSINENRQKALNETIKNIEEAGYTYSIENNLGYSENYKNLDINLLKEKGIIENKEIINPVTNEKLSGCLLYRYVNHQYEFKYTEPCQEVPIIAVSNKDGVFNNKGWAVTPFYVDITSNNTSYEYCISDKECIPNTISDTGQVYINNNDVNYVCVKTSNEIGSTDIVCGLYKLDTSVPTFVSTTVYFDKGDIKLTNLL